MFTLKKTPTKLEKAIDALIEELDTVTGDSDEYTKMTENLVKLTKIASEKTKITISPDAVLAIAGNLAGILLILNYEQINVVASKALGFVHKARI